MPEFDLQFHHFLVRDEEPLLFHAGLKAMFPLLRDAAATLIDPTQLRHIAWSHFESDEIGGLNHWLELAPLAQPVCTLVGKLVSVDDVALRPARGMAEGDVLSTGQYRQPSISMPSPMQERLLVRRSFDVSCNTIRSRVLTGVPERPACLWRCC